MAQNKTQKTNLSVEDFINSVDNEVKRNDAFKVLEIMKQITGESPKLWGTSIIGFGDVHYKYASGREGDWFKVGFSPRKSALSLYLMGCDISKADHILSKLGKYKTGKGCLYVNKLTDINIEVLKELIKTGYESGYIGTENVYNQ